MTTPIQAALKRAADVIELFDDATMQGNYMLDAGECAGIIRALADSPDYAALQAAPAQGSIDTAEFRRLVGIVQGWKDEKMVKNNAAMELIAHIDAHIAQRADSGDAPALTVWSGAMPESNGKSNFTATLMRKGGSLMDSGNFTFVVSEYPDRVRYEADCMRYLIGELDAEPCILDYDAEKHSGYSAPAPIADVPHELGYPVPETETGNAYTNGWNDCRKTMLGEIPDDPTNLPAPIADEVAGELDDGKCKSCVNDKCVTGEQCVACENPPSPPTNAPDAPAGHAEPVAGCRTAFEAFFSRYGKIPDSVKRARNGGYELQQTAYDWVTWKESWKAATAAPVAAEPAPAIPAQPGIDMRAAFETWVRKTCSIPEGAAVNWDGDDWTVDTWEGWQAAWKAKREPTDEERHLEAVAKLCGIVRVGVVGDSLRYGGDHE